MTIREALARPLNGYRALIILLVSISVSGASLSVALTANRNSERKLCAIAESNATQYREIPATTPAGQNVASNWEDLIRILHCPKRGKI